MDTIMVDIRNKYGNELIYPVCQKAHLFTKLVKQQTLTKQDIEIIKTLGFTVKVMQQSRPDML